MLTFSLFFHITQINYQKKQFSNGYPTSLFLSLPIHSIPNSFKASTLCFQLVFLNVGLYVSSQLVETSLNLTSEATNTHTHTHTHTHAHTHTHTHAHTLSLSLSLSYYRDCILKLIEHETLIKVFWCCLSNLVDVLDYCLLLFGLFFWFKRPKNFFVGSNLIFLGSNSR